jgi:hypothetical protein
VALHCRISGEHRFLGHTPSLAARGPGAPPPRSKKEENGRVPRTPTAQILPRHTCHPARPEMPPTPPGLSVRGGCGGFDPPQQNERNAPCSLKSANMGRSKLNSGGVLLSHTLTSAVPSALEGLASGFGMGPGVSPPLTPPKHYEKTSHTPPTAIPSQGDAGRFPQNRTVDA